MTFLPDERGRGGEKLGLSGGRVGGKSMSFLVTFTAVIRDKKTMGFQLPPYVRRNGIFFITKEYF